MLDDGILINTSHDKWISNEGTLIQINGENQAPIQVSGLINMIEGRLSWDTNLIKHLWGPFICCKITGIPLGGKDIPCWGNNLQISTPLKPFFNQWWLGPLLANGHGKSFRRWSSPQTQVLHVKGPVEHPPNSSQIAQNKSSTFVKLHSMSLARRIGGPPFLLLPDFKVHMAFLPFIHNQAHWPALLLTLVLVFCISF